MVLVGKQCLEMADASLKLVVIDHNSVLWGLGPTFDISLDYLLHGEIAGKHSEGESESGHDEIEAHGGSFKYSVLLPETYDYLSEIEDLETKRLYDVAFSESICGYLEKHSQLSTMDIGGQECDQLMNGVLKKGFILAYSYFMGESIDYLRKVEAIIENSDVEIVYAPEVSTCAGQNWSSMTKEVKIKAKIRCLVQETSFKDLGK